MINLIANITKAFFTVFGNRQSVTLQNNNMYTSGYNLTNMMIISPYGDFSLPINNTNAVLIPINGSTKAMTCIGYIQSLPANSPVILAQGESARISQNWAIVWHNTGLNAYKLDNPSYSATLPSCEWFSKFVQDLIEDNNTNIRNYINDTIVAVINTHVHTGVTSGTGTSGILDTPIPTTLPTNTTLTNDNTSINNQECYLNNNAMPV